jgi:peptidyl-tRNA hydrolase, PTH1 family
MKYLIVGLGNPGAEYENTRHNIGFIVADKLAGTAGAVFSSGRYASVTSFRLKGRAITLLKPTTYMNLSGNAVRYWMQSENIPLENILVITDDLALPFGKLRLRGSGSAGGHNGLTHIEQTLGTQQYARLRFGIGNEFLRGKQVDYVLGTWSDEENKTLAEQINLAVDVVHSFVLTGLAQTMNQFNKK